MYGYVRHSPSLTYLSERFKLLAGFRSMLFLDRYYYDGIFNPLGHQNISTSGHFRSIKLCISVKKGSQGEVSIYSTKTHHEMR